MSPMMPWLKLTYNDNGVQHVGCLISISVHGAVCLHVSWVTSVMCAHFWFFFFFVKHSQVYHLMLLSSGLSSQGSKLNNVVFSLCYESCSQTSLSFQRIMIAEELFSFVPVCSLLI